MNPCQKLRRALGSEKAPYIITLAFAGLGWTITHSVQRLEAIPILAYSASGPTGGETSGKLTYSVANLSQRTFRNIYLHLAPVRDRKPHLSVPETEYLPPGMANPVWDRAAVMDGEMAVFSIAELQPGWTVRLRAAAKTNEARLMYYTEEETKPEAPPFRLMEAGFMTWMVDNEFGVLVGVIASWLGLIVLFAILL
jgi:hypothetical protein